MKYAIRMATICAAALGCKPLAADPDRISLLLGSYHAGTTLEYDEVNPGIFLTWDNLIWNNRLSLNLGVFRNSYGNPALGGTVSYPLLPDGPWGIDLFAGSLLYPEDSDQFAHAVGDFIPLAGVQLRYRNAFLQAIPAGGETVDATFTYGVTFKLD